MLCCKGVFTKKVFCKGVVNDEQLMTTLQYKYHAMKVPIAKQ